MQIVIPAQRFARAKSRLRPVWSDAQRAHAAQWMLERMLNALRQSAASKNHQVIVLTDDDGVCDIARAHNAIGLKDDPSIAGHGEQLLAFANKLPATESLLVLMGDLPLIDVRSMQDLLAACQSADVLLAPDRHAQGTNAAYFANAQHRRLHFGHADSFLRHRAACRADARVVVHDAPAFRHDLDAPEDLRALQEWQRTHAPQDEALARFLWGSQA